MKRIILGVVLGAVVATSFGAQATETQKIRVRWCPEDAIHVGRGDFDGTRWDRYVCIARDDFRR